MVRFCLLQDALTLLTLVARLGSAARQLILHADAHSLHIFHVACPVLLHLELLAGEAPVVFK